MCDEVDLERGVKVQRVKVLNLLDASGFDNNRTWHINTKTNFGAGTSYIPVEWFAPVTKCLCNTFPVQMNLYQTGTSADLSIYYSRTGDVISLKSALFNPKGNMRQFTKLKLGLQRTRPIYMFRLNLSKPRSPLLKLLLIKPSPLTRPTPLCKRATAQG